MFPDLEYIKTLVNGLRSRIEKVEGKQPTGNYLTDKDLDATLNETGKAADAKAVGDALSTLSEEIAAIPSGKDGITPTIGESGNWYLGDTDTGKPSHGYTPVKGTDYWTAEDQQSIVADVLAALPTWEGGSY